MDKTIKKIIYNSHERLKVMVTNIGDIIISNNHDNQHTIYCENLKIKTICVLTDHVVILYINNSLVIYKVDKNGINSVYTHYMDKLFQSHRVNLMMLIY